jgi:hypothetical protein
MILLDDIEKLINEHGSASILRDHVALLREQMTALEKENVALKTQIKELKIIKGDKKNTDDCGDVTPKKLFHDSLPEEQINLLKLMAESITEEEKIVTAAKRNTEAVRFDLEELKEAGLIEIQLTCGFTFCNLTQEGRMYLKKSGLLT